MNDFLEFIQLALKFSNPNIPMSKKEIDTCKTILKNIIDNYNNIGQKSKNDMKDIIDSSDDATFVISELSIYTNTHNLSL